MTLPKLYISQESFKRLKSELNALLKEDRPKIVKMVTEAAAMGDRSENAEYIYGKKRLREIDRRVRFLQRRLLQAEIVENHGISEDKICFGCFIKLLDENNQTHIYQLAGPDDISSGKNIVTYTSPIGRALLGKKIGDEVTIKRPAGDIHMKVIKVSFEDLDH